MFELVAVVVATVVPSFVTAYCATSVDVELHERWDVALPDKQALAVSECSHSRIENEVNAGACVSTLMEISAAEEVR